MRVRKESGDFEIKLTSGAGVIPKGLSAAQLLGYVVDDGSNLVVVTAVTATETGCELTAGEATYEYVKETGAVTTAD